MLYAMLVSKQSFPLIEFLLKDTDIEIPQNLGLGIYFIFDHTDPNKSVFLKGSKAYRATYKMANRGVIGTLYPIVTI